MINSSPPVSTSKELFPSKEMSAPFIVKFPLEVTITSPHVDKLVVHVSVEETSVDGY